MAEFSVGRPEAFQAMWSQSDDVTVFGALGGTARGWAEVEPRLAWAARQTTSPPFTSDAKEFDYTPISEVFGADLGHTVWLENLDGTVWSGLRVTHVYRLEDDQWKIVHRHAGPLVEIAMPSRDALPLQHPEPGAEVEQTTSAWSGLAEVQPVIWRRRGLRLAR